jgi:hypothetical protein
MNHELVIYIRSKLQEKQEIQTILTELKNAGHSDASINEAFHQAMLPESQPNIIPPVPNTEKLNGANSETKNRIFDLHTLDATKTFVFIGALLILIALIIVLVSQWSNVGPGTRVAFLAIPMFVLFGLATVLKTQSKYKEIYDACLITGAIILPFTVGTFLYQFKIIKEIDAQMVMVCSLTGYILYTAIEMLTRNSKMAVLSLSSLYTFAIAAMLNYELSTQTILWALLFLSGCVGGFGFILQRNKLESGESYTGIGIILGSFLLPVATLVSLNDLSQLSSELNASFISAFGCMYLGLSIWLYQINKKFGNKSFLDSKRILESLAPLMIVFPFILVGYDNIAMMVVGIALSFAAIFASISIRIRTLLATGAIGVVFGILAISGKYFVNSLGWPIVVFLSGFAMIGVSFLVRNVRHLSLSHQDSSHYLGLGDSPESELAGHHNHGIGCGQIALIFLILTFIVPIIYWLIISASFRTRYPEITSIEESSKRARDARRSSDVISLGTALELYKQDNGKSMSQDILNTKTATCIGTKAPCKDLSDELLPGYIPLIPTDPGGTGITTGTTENTQYTIQYDASTQKITIAAPNAESGQVINSVPYNATPSSDLQNVQINSYR